MPEVLTPVDKDDPLLSGRDLDAAVAERVMGWFLVDRREMGWKPNGPDVWATGDEENPTFQLFTPSTSISAAMEVVEKMRQRGYRWNAQTPRGRGWEIQCYLTTTRGRGDKFKGLLPEAICRAALAAIEAKN